MNPWHKLANWANPYGSGFSKRPCPSNKSGRETEGDTGWQCHLCRLEVSERTPSSSHPCSLSCPLHLLPLQVHFWFPSCLLLSHSLPMVPPAPPRWSLPARPLSLQALGRLLGPLGHGSEPRNNKRDNCTKLLLGERGREGERRAPGTQEMKGEKCVQGCQVPLGSPALVPYSGVPPSDSLMSALLARPTMPQLK